MKKKRVQSSAAALLLTTILAAGSLNISVYASDGEKTAAAQGAVLNICTSTANLKQRVIDYVSGYEETDDTHGIITAYDGTQTQVVWRIIENTDLYQNYLDENLYDNLNMLPNERIDLFMADSSYLKKYTGADADLAIPVRELGITQDEIAERFAYTQAVGSDEDGNVRALSYKANAAVMVYRRDIASEVFGTDEREVVQEHFKDLASMKEAAAALESKGYQLTATADDLYRLYEASRSSGWVQDGKLVIDPVLETWVQDSRAMIDRGMLSPNEIYSTDWNTGLYTDGNVFAYFLPVSMFNSRMWTASGTSVSSKSGWAATNGPAAFAWGDSCYLLAARGSDNLALDALLMRTLACDRETLSAMHDNNNMDVNSVSIVSALAASEDAGKKSLGGQNPYNVVLENAQAVSSSLMGPYDAVIQKLYLNYMRYYLRDQLTYEEAVKNFRTAVHYQLKGLKVN